MSNRVLGLDIGGVLNNHDEALSALRILKSRFSKVIIVSRVSALTDEGLEHRKRSLEWLDRKGFYETLGIDSSNVYFCNEHRDKAPICRDLEVTDFVDDRLEVLGALYELGIRNLFLYNPRYLEVERNKQYLDKVKVVENWAELEEIF